MNNAYDLLQQQPNAQKSFDTDAWKLKKQQEREFAFATIEDMTTRVTSDMTAFQSYLDKQAQFDQYSVSNVFLIMAQNPEATKLKDYDNWKELGASVKPHQKGLVVLEPTPEYTRADGSKATSFKTKALFDVAQTFTKKPQQQVEKPDSYAVLKALIQSAPVPIHAVEELPVPTMGAFYDHAQKAILIRCGLTNDQIFQSLSQEIAHAQFARGEYTRPEYGFKAYCVSYMLCKKHQIDTSFYQFSELPPEFSGEQSRDVRAEIGKIRDGMQQVNGAMQAVLQKEKRAKQPPNER